MQRIAPAGSTTAIESYYYKMGKTQGNRYAAWHTRDDSLLDLNYQAMFKRQANQNLQARIVKKTAEDTNFLAGPYQAGFMDGVASYFKCEPTKRKAEAMQAQRASIVAEVKKPRTQVTANVAPVTQWVYEPVPRLEKPRLEKIQPIPGYHLTPMSFQFDFEMSVEVSPRQVSVRGMFHHAQPVQASASVNPDSMELEAAQVLATMSNRQ